MARFNCDLYCYCSYKGYHIQNECCLLASSQLDAVLLLNHLQTSVRKTRARNFYSNCSLCRKAFCLFLTICHWCKIIKSEFFLIISIQYQADKWWELRKIAIMGLFIDPIPNSLNQHLKNYMPHGKENY